MSNKDISKGAYLSDRRGYVLYLRSESIKKIIDPNYHLDKSYDGYKNSKFYTSDTINYSQYLADSIDNSISYSEYISENLNKSIVYSEYISEQIVYGN